MTAGESNTPAILHWGSQTVRVLMGILLFLTPFYSLTTPKEFCFYLALLLVIGLTLFYKNRVFSFDSPLLLPFLLFISWACLGLISALNRENSVHDIFLHLFKYLAIYYMVLNFFNSRRLFLVLSWVFVTSASIFSFGALIYFYLILGNPPATLFRIHNYIYGYFHFWTVFASLLAVQLLFEDYRWRRRLFLLFSLCAMVLIVILSQTRSALVAIAVGLLVYFLKNIKISIFLVVFTVISFFVISSMSNRLSLSTIQDHINVRIGITYLFFEMFKDHPLAGVGFGMQTYDDPALLNKYNQRVPLQFRQDPPVRIPHNLFTDVAVRVGGVGLAFFLFLLGRFMKTGWILVNQGRDEFIRKWSLSLMGAFFAFLINAMAMDATFGVQAVVFYSLLAMMTVLWRIQKLPGNPAFSETKAA